MNVGDLCKSIYWTVFYGRSLSDREQVIIKPSDVMLVVENSFNSQMKVFHNSKLIIVNIDDVTKF